MSAPSEGGCDGHARAQSGSLSIQRGGIRGSECIPPGVSAGLHSSSPAPVRLPLYSVRWLKWVVSPVRLLRPSLRSEDRLVVQGVQVSCGADYCAFDGR